MTARTKQELYDRFCSGGSATNSISQIEQEFEDLIDSIGSFTLSVAASNASNASKGRADYVCDGTADDVEIQAAIDALPSGGGRVVLSEGTYIISSTIYVKSFTNLVGVVGGLRMVTWSVMYADKGVSIKLADNSNPANGMISFQFDDDDIIRDVYLQNLAVDGNKANNPTCGNLLNFNAAAGQFFGLHLRHVFVINGISNGIYINKVWRFSMYYVLSAFHDADGCEISACPDASTISSSYFFNNGLRGMDLRISGNILISSSDFSGNGWQGLHITGSQRNTVIGSMFVGNGQVTDDTYEAIKVYDSEGNIINACAFYNELTVDNGHNYAIGELGTSNKNVFSNIHSKYHRTGIIQKGGADTALSGIQGYQNSGTATLVNGQTSIVVTHGLDVTPAAGDIMVTPIESLGSANEFYIDTYSSTQFTINVDGDPGADVDFAWKAIVL